MRNSGDQKAVGRSKQTAQSKNPSNTLTPVKLSFKNESEIKILPDKTWETGMLEHQPQKEQIIEGILKIEPEMVKVKNINNTNVYQMINAPIAGTITQQYSRMKYRYIVQYWYILKKSLSERNQSQKKCMISFVWHVYDTQLYKTDESLPLAGNEGGQHRRQGASSGGKKMF